MAGTVFASFPPTTAARTVFDSTRKVLPPMAGTVFASVPPTTAARTVLNSASPTTVERNVMDSAPLTMSGTVLAKLSCPLAARTMLDLVLRRVLRNQAWLLFYYSPGPLAVNSRHQNNLDVLAYLTKIKSCGGTKYDRLTPVVQTPIERILQQPRK